jgi:hypothetical protein
MPAEPAIGPLPVEPAIRGARTRNTYPRRGCTARIQPASYRFLLCPREIPNTVFLVLAHVMDPTRCWRTGAVRCGSSWRR